MNIDYTVTALMFPAIPLLMNVYANRFHTLFSRQKLVAAFNGVKKNRKVPVRIQNLVTFFIASNLIPILNNVQ